MFRRFCNLFASRQPSPSMPVSLWKAMDDSYRYLIRLRTGVTLIFAEATLSEDGEWIHLSDVQIPGSARDSHSLGFGPEDFSLGRGIDVRLADVVLVADCDS